MISRRAFGKRRRLRTAATRRAGPSRHAWPDRAPSFRTAQAGAIHRRLDVLHFTVLASDVENRAARHQAAIFGHPSPPAPGRHARGDAFFVVIFAGRGSFSRSIQGRECGSGFLDAGRRFCAKPWYRLSFFHSNAAPTAQSVAGRPRVADQRKENGPGGFRSSLGALRATLLESFAAHRIFFRRQARCLVAHAPPEVEAVL